MKHGHSSAPRQIRAEYWRGGAGMGVQPGSQLEFQGGDGSTARESAGVPVPVPGQMSRHRSVIQQERDGLNWSPHHLASRAVETALILTRIRSLSQSSSYDTTRERQHYKYSCGKERCVASHCKGNPTCAVDCCVSAALPARAITASLLCPVYVHFTMRARLQR